MRWSVQEGYSSHGSISNIDANYRESYAEINGGYGCTQNNSKLSYGLQSGVVVHREGTTFGQPMGETVASIATKGTDRVRARNQTGVQTYWRGYTIVPYLSH